MTFDLLADDDTTEGETPAETVPKAPPEPAGEPVAAPVSERSVAAKERYKGLSEAEQARTRAAMLAKDPRFWDWCHANSEEGAANFIRATIGGSLSLIAKRDDAYQKFLWIEVKYQQATGLAAAPR